MAYAQQVVPKPKFALSRGGLQRHGLPVGVVKLGALFPGKATRAIDEIARNVVGRITISACARSIVTCSRRTSSSRSCQLITALELRPGRPWPGDLGAWRMQLATTGASF